MNSAMYDNAATQANLEALRARGYCFIDPERGFLAERESGVGRSRLETISRGDRADTASAAVSGGETRRDHRRPDARSVRSDSLRQQCVDGSTGIELAREAALRGADVTLLLGPTLLEPHPGVRVVRFTSAQELYDAALTDATGADVTIATAAVADWRPAERAESKLKKTDEDLAVRMVRNPDVLGALGERKG